MYRFQKRPNITLMSAWEIKKSFTNFSVWTKFDIHFKILAHKGVDDWIHKAMRHRNPMAEKVCTNKGIIFELRIDIQEVWLEVDQYIENLYWQPANCEYANDRDQHFKNLENIFVTTANVIDQQKCFVMTALANKALQTNQSMVDYSLKNPKNS